MKVFCPLFILYWKLRQSVCGQRHPISLKQNCCKKKRPKSRRGNCLVLPHASYNPDFASLVTHGHTSKAILQLKSLFCTTSTFQVSYFNRIVKLRNFTCKFVPKSSLPSIDIFKNFLKQTLTSLLQKTLIDMGCPCTWSLVRSCTFCYFYTCMLI